MSGSDNNQDERGAQDLPPSGERRDSGRTGEGAASVLAHIVSQGEQHHRRRKEADDAAGSSRA